MAAAAAGWWWGEKALPLSTEPGRVGVPNLEVYVTDDSQTSKCEADSRKLAYSDLSNLHVYMYANI